MATLQVNLKKVCSLYPDSFLGKFYQLFGEEQTEKFLTIFGGLEVRVPGPKELLTLAREQVIWEYTGKAKTQKSMEEGIKAAAERIGWPEQAVRNTFNEMSQRLADREIW